MVESYLHKMAKELLYNEIVDKGIFEFKTNDIATLPIGNHGVYMEFPSIDKSCGGGWYPDECGCTLGTCVYKNEEYEDIYILDNGKKYTAGSDRYSLKTNPGYCCCGLCGHVKYSDSIVHDIASIHKGTVVFAIEIINKHTPSWHEIESTLNYQVYLIRAVDILKRVDNTPVYVYCIMGNRCWS